MLEQLNSAFETQGRQLEHRRQQLVQQITSAAEQQLTLLSTQQEAAEQVAAATNVSRPALPVLAEPVGADCLRVWGGAAAFGTDGAAAVHRARH